MQKRIKFFKLVICFHRSEIGLYT